ncbi:hypothetical protein FOBRF1_007129 [Fusarium oxysporum]
MKNPTWDPDEYFAPEYFTNSLGSSETFDFLPADFPMACQPSPEMDLDSSSQDTNTEPLSRETSGPLTPTGENEYSLNQLSSTNNMACPMTEIQLRSASRKPKNHRRRGPAAGIQTHARECHNLVEKQYRTRLKSQFERLLAVLPAAHAQSLAYRDSTAHSDQVLSRGQVLDLARHRILELEDELEIVRGVRRGGYPNM